MAASLLILTDFFQAANRDLDYATNLAVPLGARLVLLHVRRDSVLDPEMFTSKLSNLSQQAVDLALNRISTDLPVPVVAEVGHGRIASAVSCHHPTLVVLGRPNVEDLPDELVSTTALDILRLAPYPMLIVPHGATATHPPRRLLLAVDGEPFSLGRHVGAICHLLDALHAEVTVLHVAPHTGPMPTTAAALASVESTDLTTDLVPSVRTRGVIAPSPAEGILQTAQPGEYDAVVVIARPRSFAGQLFHHSVTAQVLLHSTVPVLVLPSDE